MVLTLLILLCNHNNWMLKLSTSEKHNCLDEGRIFISIFKIGSVPGMINKEVLA